MPEPVRNPHIKPTKEELEAENARIVAEDEALKKQEEERIAKEEADRIAAEGGNPTPAPSPSQPVPSASPSEPVPSATPSPSEPVPSVSVSPSEEVPGEPKPPVEPKKPDSKAKVPDLKERYDASTREAQKLYRDNVTMANAIAAANLLPNPTVEELQAANPEWDTMSDVEKRAAEEIFIAKRFREHVNGAAVEIKSVQDWQDKVEKFVEDPQTLIDHPELEGKVEAFKVYAGDRTVQGTNFDILVPAFLHEASKAKAAKPVNKGQMFEQGKGGPSDKGKKPSTKLSVADSANLARNNYKEYLKQLRAGNISTEVE